MLLRKSKKNFRIYKISNYDFLVQFYYYLIIMSEKGGCCTSLKLLFAEIINIRTIIR